jgi:hypothetical protein
VSYLFEFPSYELLLSRAFTNDGGTICAIVVDKY